jgi:hypothetical protein
MQTCLTRREQQVVECAACRHLKETNAEHGAAPQASLALSPEQREAMLAHRQIKLAALARLVQERREIQASLQVGTRALRLHAPVALRLLHVRCLASLQVGRKAIPSKHAPAVLAAPLEDIKALLWHLPRMGCWSRCLALGICVAQ